MEEQIAYLIELVNELKAEITSLKQEIKQQIKQPTSARGKTADLESLFSAGRMWTYIPSERIEEFIESCDEMDEMIFRKWLTTLEAKNLRPYGRYKRGKGIELRPIKSGIDTTWYITISAEEVEVFDGTPASRWNL